MSLKLSVSQAREADKGNQLPGLTGKVKVVFQQKAGARNDGAEYVSQGIVISDVANPKLEIIANIYDQPPYDKSIVGKVVTITPGEKGGLKSGGSYEKQKPDGSTENVYTVSVSKVCDLTFDGAGGTAPAATTQAPRPAAAQPHRPTQQLPAITWADFLAAEEELAVKCIESACRVSNRVSEGVATLCGQGFDPAQVLSLANWIRIEAAKAGLTMNSPNGGKPASKAPQRPEPDDIPFGGGDDEQP